MDYYTSTLWNEMHRILSEIKWNMRTCYKMGMNNYGRMIMNSLVRLVVVSVGGFGLLVSIHAIANAQEVPEQLMEETLTTGMNNEQLAAIIQRIDPEYTGRPGLWQLRIESIGDKTITVITDTNADRMRIVIPIRKADDLNQEEMYRILQANYDSALDARYAIGQGILWSTFIHPLSSLNDKDFLSGMGQTINIVTTYGKTYSSGMFTFGGGDSNELLEKQLLEELQKKGQAI